MSKEERSYFVMVSLFYLIIVSGCLYLFISAMYP